MFQTELPAEEIVSCRIKITKLALEAGAAAFVCSSQSADPVCPASPPCTRAKFARESAPPSSPAPSSTVLGCLRRRRRGPPPSAPPRPLAPRRSSAVRLAGPTSPRTALTPPPASSAPPRRLLAGVGVALDILSRLWTGRPPVPGALLLLVLLAGIEYNRRCAI